MNRIKSFIDTLKQTFTEWNDSESSRNAMSMAYCAIFSIPGLLIIIIWTAGIFFGEEAIRGEISNQIKGVMGNDAAKGIEQMIADSMVNKQSVLMKIVGILSLVFGATTLFFQLQKSLNELWEVKAKPQKAMMKFLKDRANSFGMILVLCFLLMITMTFSSLISYFNNLITRFFSLETYAVIQALNFVVGFILIGLVFAFIFKILPDVEIQWKSVWAGAAVTAVLFTIGKFLLSLYFTQVKPTSVFGTAGTVVLIMLWVNYTCMILFFGAIFTRVYAEKKGHAFKPSKHADWAPAHLVKNT